MKETVNLDSGVLRAAIQACIDMGPLRTSDPYLYHEFGFNCDMTSITEADKSEIFKVFALMRDIAEEMERRGQTADSFLVDD